MDALSKLAALAIAAILAAPAAAQVSPQMRVAKFAEIYGKADPAGRALAFDVLAPADEPRVLQACFGVLNDPHPLVLAAAADFLAGTKGEAALETLLGEGIGHAREEVRLACVTALGDPRGQPRPLDRLLPLLEDRSWHARAAALEAVGRLRVAGGAERAASLADDADPRVRVAALLALRDFNDLATAPKVVARLRDESWPVRSAAIEAVRTMRPRTAVEPLIDRLEKEPGRLRLEAHRVLVSLAGRDLGPDPGPWRDWWEGQLRRHGLEGRVEVEPSDYVIRPSKTVTRRFFEVTTTARRIVFVLDVSDSMNRTAKPLRPMEGVGPDETTTRFEILRHEILLSLDGFAENDGFNVILFGTDVHAFKSGLVPATAKNRADAVSFLRSRGLCGETNLFDALALAFGVAPRTLATCKGYLDEVGGGKKWEELARGPEAIFLLSDGVPNRGAVQKPDAIVREIARANRTRRIEIHTVAVGRFQADFMRRLAVASGGTCVTVGEGGVR